MLSCSQTRNEFRAGIPAGIGVTEGRCSPLNYQLRAIQYTLPQPILWSILTIMRTPALYHAYSLFFLLILFPEHISSYRFISSLGTRIPCRCTGMPFATQTFRISTCCWTESKKSTSRIDTNSSSRREFAPYKRKKRLSRSKNATEKATSLTTQNWRLFNVEVPLSLDPGKGRLPGSAAVGLRASW